MFLELIKKRDKKSGRVTGRLYMTEYINHRRRRRYIPVSSMLTEALNYVAQRRQIFMKKICRKALERKRRGAPPKITHAQQELLFAAGFNLHRNEIRRDRRRFLTEEAAAVRFALLEDDNRTVIQSPAKLLEYERRSLSMMRAHASRGIGIGFKECFDKLLSQACETAR